MLSTRMADSSFARTKAKIFQEKSKLLMKKK
jgi:hypothetical protein